MNARRNGAGAANTATIAAVRFSSASSERRATRPPTGSGKGVRVRVQYHLHAFVQQAVRVHADADACFVEQVHRDLFDDAGANAAEDILASLPLQNDVIDAVPMQELTEQESRRAGADNGDLSACLRLHASS